MNPDLLQAAPTPEPPLPRLLWVDDQIQSLSSFIEALTTKGFVVTRAGSTDEALQKASTTAFDLCLVDIRMPPPDGIECLRRLHRANPNAKLASMSSFHYLERYKNQLRALEFPVQLMDKDFPDALAPDFDEMFIAPLKSLASKGVTTTIREMDQMLKEGIKASPFSITLAEFNRLPLAAKDQLRLQAQKESKETIERAFTEGKIWVMLCGDSKTVRASAMLPEEVFSDEKITEFARAQRRPAFHFWKPVTSEDTWSSCSVNGSPTFYPTVTLQFGETHVTVHFDTGSPMTFFSYEELRGLQIIKRDMEFGIGQRSGFTQEYFAAPLREHVILRCQVRGETRTILVTGQAVRDWESSPFVRRCNSKCPGKKVADEPTICPDRKALIGRNLLVENALVLILDGKLRKTSFTEE